jgi:hypothetical protein
MLRASPIGWFSWNFILSEDGERLAEINLAWLREAGQLSVGEESYRVYREGIMSGAFVLEKDGVRLARAEKPSALYRSFNVAYDGKYYMLEAESAFRRKFVLKDGSEHVGSIYPEGALTRKCIVDLPEGIPLAVRTFIVWLVIILWKRESDAGAAAAAAG